MMAKLDWQRVKGGDKPHEYQKVLLHTPQFGMTTGEVITGIWDGTEWQADDGRDFEGTPPVHWALLDWPDFEGDDDEWSHQDLGDFDDLDDPTA